MGRAGSGKIRMAVELIARLDRQEPGRWHAGFATGRELRRFVQGKAAFRNPLAGEGDNLTRI
jgi:hypothetical protein